MLDIFVQSRYHINRRKLKRRVKLFLEKVGVSLEDYDLSLAIVGDRKMGELNYKFCKKKETTPVLAFPMDVVAGLVPTSNKKAPTRLRQGFDGQARGAITILGEIVVSYPQARLLAEQENKLVDEKIGELIEHGLTKLLTSS